ncbi:hypothetical protein [Streptomyces sp. NPDC002057]|uniref:hypothetical protein n=1 Tax=Streptomyces sp. NPDC002057 TaxID=3154664 RepID=UPI0033329C6E
MARARTAVVATTLIAALASATLGGTAAFAAPAVPAALTAAGAGTVVQNGGPVTVAAGEEGAVTLRFTASLPAGVRGPVTGAVHLPTTLHAVAGNSPVSENVVRSTCSVNGVAYGACRWNMPFLHDFDEADPPSLDLPAVPAARTLAYSVTVDADRSAVALVGTEALVALKDTTGAVVARGTVGLRFVPGTPPPHERGAVHARDAAGVLWRYEGTGDVTRPFAVRKRVGGGWNAYTVVTPVVPATADGRGGLVARDRAGVLWYYEGTGDPSAPFAPRQRVGGGWSVYTALVGTGDGGLVARDRDGALWRYQAGLRAPFGPRERVGGGWNTYTALTMAGTYDGVLGRDKDGVLWKYDYFGSVPGEPFRPRLRVGGGWNVYSAVAGGTRLGRDEHPDVVARDRAGRLWLYPGVGRPVPSRGDVVVPGSTRTLVGGGWNTYDLIF